MVERNTMHDTLRLAAIEAMKAKVLETLSEEDRDKIISDAVSQIIATDRSGWPHHEPNLSKDAMRGAITRVLSQIYDDLIAEPENKKKLQDAAQKAFDKLCSDVVKDQFIDAFRKAFMQEKY